MTDNEIIKALECCKKDDCYNCPNDFGNCYANLAGFALDLINRQKAEIERLQETICMLTKTGRFYSKVRAEAIKEFAERLKETICQENELYEKCVKDMLTFDYQRGYADSNDRFVWCIDNLVKEMVGDV